VLLNGNGWLRAISLGDAIETEDRTKRTQGERRRWIEYACLFDQRPPSQTKLRTLDRLMCPSTQTRFGKPVMILIRLVEDSFFFGWAGAIICCGFGKHDPPPD